MFLLYQGRHHLLFEVFYSILFSVQSFWQHTDLGYQDVMIPLGVECLLSLAFEQLHQQ